MKQIELKGVYGQGKFTQVSDEDFDFVSSLKLHVSDHGYVKTYYKGKHRPLHQLIAGKGYDHANGLKLDNRRENLRKATKSQNNVNTPARSSTGCKGVYKTPWGYEVKVSKNRRTVYIGTFEDIEHAKIIADLWNIDLHGVFARTNLPVFRQERSL